MAEVQLDEPNSYYVTYMEVFQKIYKTERFIYARNIIHHLTSRYSGFCLFLFNTLLFLSLLTFIILPTSWYLFCLKMMQLTAIKFLPFVFSLVLFSWIGFLLVYSEKDFSRKSCMLFSILLEILFEFHHIFGVEQIGNWTICALFCVAVQSWGLLFQKEDFYSTCILTFIVLLRYILMENISFVFGSLLFYLSIFGGLLLSSVVKVIVPPRHMLSGRCIEQDTSAMKEACEMSKVPVIRRRRASSIEIPTASQNGVKSTSTKTRRKSLPALGGQVKKVSISNMDFSCLGEAHGMITDLLVDSTLPPNVIGTLRIVADMLSPLLQQGLHRQTFNNPLITVFEKTQVQEDQKQVMNQPDLKDDTPLSLKQRLQRNLGVSSRRMSSSYTTTTSATGMPSIDVEYHAKTSSSPNNKTAHRSKSYAGIGLKTQKERYRTLSQKTMSFQESNSLHKGIDKRISVEDDIFKVEVNRSGEPVYFEGMSNGDGEDDDELINQEDPVTTRTKNRKITCIGETLEKVNEVPYQETADKLSKNDVINRPSIVLDHKEMNDKNVLGTETKESGNKLQIENLSTGQPPPLAQRNATPIVAQVSPVRKDSLNEDKKSDRKTSSELCLPSNNRRRSSRELHLEYEVSKSMEVDTMLRKLIEWDFPIFELSEKCNVLTQVVFRIFQVCGFIKKFKIPEITLIKYFRALESGYHNIPYHNRIHAADVLHGVYYLTQQKIPGFNHNPSRDENKSESLDGDCYSDDGYSYGCMANAMPDLELMALYTAAAMHDFDHPGRTNAFLVATLNPKALLYNDRSVLENHHAAAAWSLMVTNPGLNFLVGLDTAEFKRFRFIVVEEILSTDLKKHFDFLAEWNAKVSDQAGGLDFSLEADRLMVGQMAIKVADISGPSKEWTLHNRWTDRIIEEFYQQGEDEKSLGMQLSAYMDRGDPKVPELQSSFIKHLVYPLYLAYEKSGIFPGEWIDGEDSDDENPDEKYNEDDENLSDGSNSDKQCKTKKKVVYNVLLDNLEKNHEQWLKLIEEKQKLNSTEDNENRDGEKPKDNNSND